mmetsp:Transcript_90/g.222  ORF Transcript_90/g.222 Transcript_90/m.222 type:complete len:310 (+) Transcript_90:3003-3932(+)
MQNPSQLGLIPSCSAQRNRDTSQRRRPFCHFSAFLPHTLDTCHTHRQCAPWSLDHLCQKDQLGPTTANQFREEHQCEASDGRAPSPLGNLIQKSLSGDLLRFALGIVCGFGTGPIFELCSNGEHRRVVGAGTLHQFICGRRQFARLGPFLQRSLRVAGVRIDSFHAVAPEAQDQTFGNIKPRIPVDSGQDGLHRIAQQCLFATTAGHHLRAAKLQRGAEVNFAGHVGTGFFTYQGVEARGQRAFSCRFVVLQKGLGHHQTKHAVPKKLKALVVLSRGRGHGRVRDCAHQKLWPGKFVPQPQFQCFEFRR